MEVQTELYNLEATCHMSLFHKQFVTYHPIDAWPITIANSKVFYAIGMGDLQIEISNGITLNKVILKDMFHISDLYLTVVSVGCIIKARYTMQFVDDMCQIKAEDSHIIRHIPAGINGLFKVDHAFVVADQAASDKSMDILTLHRRLGHISINTIHALYWAGSITGIYMVDNFPPFICNFCEYAKMTCKPIQKECVAPLAQFFGDKIHTNVWGPLHTLSLGEY